jgi:aerobic carbon-monoxide dehydrogenase medium subunit
MDDFKYFSAKNLMEACTLVAQYGEEAKILSGGQSLVNMMKQNLVIPSYIIDIKSIPDLDYIRYDDVAGLSIGALTTHRSLEKSAIVKDKYFMLTEMELHLASMAVRNWGTVGGNLCSADPASDLATSLIALGAELTLTSENGERRVLLEDFIVDSFETVLREDEILTQIRIPAYASKNGGSHIKFGRRATDLGIVVVATHLTLDESDSGRCKNIRIVLGSVDPFPQRYKRAEDLINGQKINDTLMEKAARAVFEDCQPTSDINGTSEYKREIARVIVKRSLKEAATRAGTC